MGETGSNRTFMELKLLGSHSFVIEQGVLIVPLWNWNTKANVGPDTTPVLIVPLWNWNLTSDGIAGNGSTSSNRTFMELKSWDCCLHTSSWKVLIVPLWNWNISTLRFGFLTVCSNRTFMELKYSTSKMTVQSVYSSNRTFMELK